MRLLRGYRAIRYIFWEMLPSFFLGVIVFVLILLMFQALRLTEFILVHGVDFSTVLQIVAFLSVSFLPAIFPMSLLFSVLLTYGRLSSDSEIVAMKSIGLHMGHLLMPAILLGVIVAFMSAQTCFNLAPWGNRQFEVLITRLGAMKADIAIHEGTFSEGFFDLVVYANQVDSKHGILHKVFIYDERDPKMPLTIVAREGQLTNQQSENSISASLLLGSGSIHRTDDEGRHTKIDFQNFDLHLSNPLQFEEKKKSPPSLTIGEISQALKDSHLEPEKKRMLQTEFHKRWAISVACILFALLGVGLGTVTNRRNVRSGNLAICIGLIATYWVMYVICENMAREGQVYPAIALWVPNVIFAFASYWSLKRSWA